MKAGARDAIAIDADPHALAALALNAAANAVSLDIRAGDAASLVLPDVDMILIGDLFYSDDLAEAVTAFLDRCLDRGIEALVGDPWRRPLPLARLREVARSDVPETRLPPKPSGVFRFHRHGPLFATFITVTAPSSDS